MLRLVGRLFMPSLAPTTRDLGHSVLFIEALTLAAAVYPEANLSIGELGVILRRSKPAIAKL
jgi:hypothetical protein